MKDMGNEEWKSRESLGSRAGEIIRFAVTGGVCFLIEFALLVILRDGVGMDTLVATPIAFLVSVVVNYLVCVIWVFPGTKDSGTGAKIGFVITSVTGLLINELIMLLLRVILGEDAVLFTVAGNTVSMYMVNKIIATLVVMIWNYFTKRAILTSDGVWSKVRSWFGK